MNQPTISRADQRKTKSNTSRMQVERLQIDCIKERAMTSSYYPTISGQWSCMLHEVVST
ncbi:hypothetical protein HanXRQr2_Chr06g0239541 [Helianthus annuus]|uniref:Uncharacterized protein n=1 Tax=Helianthus annuus TaxID=4232 RepID=A0A251UER3_HELAN|nr:hypothetical protein HanXRQr2_Chr06g0239541 [Helianthus annuus]KAJ0572024.1 hypothetical protein HanHA89_Chr06g0211261 [Helianthus annuus]KAJ0913768.1 hypothetical protein HanPSC8_Chr06g0231081 [Helianthus annuus]